MPTFARCREQTGVEPENRVHVGHDSDIVSARRLARDLSAELGFDETNGTLIATAISELARNIISYAVHGEILLRIEERDSSRGITVIARDDGPGIKDVTLAMQDGYSTSGGLGLGLPGTRRLMDEFALESEVGQGTTVTATKWTRR